MGIEILEQIVAGEGTGLATFTVDQYHQMIASGILSEGPKVELLDGLLVLKDRRDRGGKLTNVGSRHAAIVTQLAEAIRKIIATGQSHVRCQQPLILPPANEPEPDVAIVLGKPANYLNQHPEADETLAVMEVADSSLRQDRDVKQRIYADAGIAAYWIVDISANQIEVYTQPLAGQGRYGRMETFGRGEAISLSLPDGTASVAVSDVLP